MASRAAVSSSWYEVVEDSNELLQGDIVRECPIPVPVIEGLEGWKKEGTPVDVEIQLADGCVLTQSCDLENDKVKEVLFGQVVDWPSARARLVKEGNEFAKGKAFRKALVQGNVPGLMLLRKHEDDPTMDWSIVDFHRLWVLPKDVTAALAKSKKRLRLISPYREHLGQEFARYFMRVGLPLNAAEFEEEGKA
jgi:hypothetical protein